MHELGLTRNVVAIVIEHARGRAVKHVRLAIGPTAGVERDALSFCFDVVTAGTELEGATLAFMDAEGDTFLVKEFELAETG